MKARILTWLFMAVFALPLMAHDLTESQVHSLQERVKQKIEEFQGYHSVIVNRDLSERHRKNAVESALALFMGKGQSYTTTDENNYVEKHRPVRMQISSIRRNSRSNQSQKMTEYLDRQYRNVLNYAKVVVESADIVRVGQIHKVNEGQYECTAYFCSKYISYNKEGKISYGDITRKKVRVSIYVKHMPDGEEIFEVKLCDVYVEATERL